MNSFINFIILQLFKQQYNNFTWVRQFWQVEISIPAQQWQFYFPKPDNSKWGKGQNIPWQLVPSTKIMLGTTGLGFMHEGKIDAWLNRWHEATSVWDFHKQLLKRRRANSMTCQVRKMVLHSLWESLSVWEGQGNSAGKEGKKGAEHRWQWSRGQHLSHTHQKDSETLRQKNDSFRDSHLSWHKLQHWKSDVIKTSRWTSHRRKSRYMVEKFLTECQQETCTCDPTSSSGRRWLTFHCQIQGLSQLPAQLWHNWDHLMSSADELINYRVHGEPVAPVHGHHQQPVCLSKARC